MVYIKHYDLVTGHTEVVMAVANTVAAEQLIEAFLRPKESADECYYVSEDVDGGPPE